jgi:hypothetical protein
MQGRNADRDGRWSDVACVAMRAGSGGKCAYKWLNQLHVKSMVVASASLAAHYAPARLERTKHASTRSS